MEWFTNMASPSTTSQIWGSVIWNFEFENFGGSGMRRSDDKFVIGNGIDKIPFGSRDLGFFIVITP